MASTPELIIAERSVPCIFSHGRTDLTGTPEGPFNVQASRKYVWVEKKGRKKHNRERDRQTYRHTETDKQ